MFKPLVIAAYDPSAKALRDEWTGETYRQQRAEARQRVNRRKPTFGKKKRG